MLIDWYLPLIADGILEVFGVRHGQDGRIDVAYVLPIQFFTSMMRIIVNTSLLLLLWWLWLDEGWQIVLQLFDHFGLDVVELVLHALLILFDQRFVARFRERDERPCRQLGRGYYIAGYGDAGADFPIRRIIVIQILIHFFTLSVSLHTHTVFLGIERTNGFLCDWTECLGPTSFAFYWLFYWLFDWLWFWLCGLDRIDWLLELILIEWFYLQKFLSKKWKSLMPRQATLSVSRYYINELSSIIFNISWLISK